MPVPVISPTTSILGYRKGQTFEYQFQPVAVGTSWAATGIPTGMTLGSSTGLLSGAPTYAGVYQMIVIATNATGPSTPLAIAIGIEDNNFNDGLGVEVNIDVLSGAVSVPGATTAKEDDPILFLKRSDKVFLDIGFFKLEEMQSLGITQIKFQIREFDGEQVVVVSSGLVENIGSNEEPRYRILVDLSGDEVTSVLGGYEGDLRTFFNAITEIEWQVSYLSGGAFDGEDLVRSSRTFRTAIDRDLIIG